jgi:hypothetical protein
LWSGRELVASPGGKSKKVVFRLLRREDTEFRLSEGTSKGADDEDSHEGGPEEKCELGWLINGQRVDGPKTKVLRKGHFATYKVNLSPLLVRELALAEKLSLRLCERKWSLRPDQVAEIRRFFELHQEEMAWQDKPRKGGTGGLVAPSGGWPDWGKPDPKAMKAAASGGAIDAPTLFKQLKRSVYQLEALLSGETLQGSAVAVTTSELLTNCHVVQGAKKIILKREKKEWVATLSRSASDGSLRAFGRRPCARTHFWGTNMG